MSKHDPRSPAPPDSQPTPVQPATLSLIDMPLHWLEQLQTEGAIDDRDDLALLRTCTFMRDHVLGRRVVRAVFNLPIKPEDVKVAQDKLLLATKYASNVHLRLEADKLSDSSPARYRCRSNGAVSAQTLLSGAVATAGHALDAIRSARLEHVELDDLVPSWLLSACPQIKALALIECRFLYPLSGFPKLPDGIPGSAQLHRLEVQCYGPWPAWWQPMNNLTGLTSLTLHRPVNMLHGCPTWLTELNLSGTKVNDYHMKILLSMSPLARVACKGFRLAHSYSERPCSWAHLEVEVLDVEQFDRLPLHGLASIHMQAPAQVAIIPSDDLATCIRVAIALVKCGGIKTTSSDLCFGHYGYHNRQRVSTECLVALLPTLATLKMDQLVVLNATVDAELLAAVADHLAGCELRSILFTSTCEWAPDAWPLVLPSLPATVSSIRIEGYAGHWTQTLSPIKESDIGAMCVTAPRPVTVSIYLLNYQSWPWDSGWDVRLANVMAAAGHKRVTLTVSGSST